ncbi:MAG: PspA/IM30 family protein [Pseudomonadota bacterium]
MGVFSRVRDIISSNLNNMLDNAEDPEKMVKLMIMEMEDALVEIKASCAGAMAARKRVERNLKEVKDRALDWAGKAELAVNKGREDLAREALLEKRRYVERADGLEREAIEVQGIIDEYQDEIRQLEEKLSSARDKQRLLVQRAIHAQRKKKAQQEIRRFDSSDTFIRFEQFENRIERLESEADLVNYGRGSNLDEELARLDREEDLEKELRALKAKAAKGAEDSREA